MQENIICPFCNNSLTGEEIKCPSCGALFKEPELKEIKFKEVVPFGIIDILTLGFFSTIWFFINFKSINNLIGSNKECLKFSWLMFLLASNGIFYLMCLFNKPSMLVIFSVIQCLIYIALTYRVLRIIQKYTLSTYETTLEYNPYYLFLFNIIYLVHFIETYTDRVFHTHEFFNIRTVQSIMLFIIFLILIFIERFYNEVLLLINH